MRTPPSVSCLRGSRAADARLLPSPVEPPSEAAASDPAASNPAPFLTSGPIPDFLGRMASLRVLYLSYNFFAGPIPNTLNDKKCGPTAFTWLDLRSNKGINGTTPAVATFLQAI